MHSYRRLFSDVNNIHFNKALMCSILAPCCLRRAEVKLLVFDPSESEASLEVMRSGKIRKRKICHYIFFMFEALFVFLILGKECFSKFFFCVSVMFNVYICFYDRGEK